MCRFNVCGEGRTGLDPAFSMPMFSQRSKRLNANDAEFVDIIHTDGGVLGNLWQMGDADFFPNQGIPLQPGCAKQEFMKNRWYSIVGQNTTKNVLVPRYICCVRGPLYKRTNSHLGANLTAMKAAPLTQKILENRKRIDHLIL